MSLFILLQEYLDASPQETGENQEAPLSALESSQSVIRVDEQPDGSLVVEPSDDQGDKPTKFLGLGQFRLL